LRSDDLVVAQAAATALGTLGGPAASEALISALASAPAAVRTAVADSCLKCAEQFRTAGHQAQALALYERLNAEGVPERARMAAMRGALLTRGVAAVPQLIEHLKSNDRQRQTLALRLVRELPDPMRPRLWRRN